MFVNYWKDNEQRFSIIGVSTERSHLMSVQSRLNGLKGMNCKEDVRIISVLVESY